MRPLRKLLTALSAAVVLLPVLCGIISGQSALTTIQDTLFDADGARYNGTLFIRWSTFDVANPGTIIQQSKSVQVVNGNLLVQLAPNNTALPPANLYSVLYQSDGNQQYSETWSVPTSTTPMKVAQVRTGGGTGGSGGGGSAGALTGTPESSITNLVSDLNARPIKGPGFGTNAIAVIDQNGQIETVTGNLGDCVFVDGTTGPCTAGVTFPTFVNGEVPTGAINGLNTTFTLANSPSATSLLLFRNGLLLQAGIDYTLSGSTVQFLSTAVPQPNDTLLAQYRIDPGSGITDPGLAIGPSGVPGMNGCGAAGESTKTGAYQIVPADNGFLLIESANANLTLPITVPAAGWCVALLDANAATITVGNAGNHINGIINSYALGSANTAYVVSDGSGYWISAAAGGAAAILPAGTGTVKVTGGAAGLVAGSATDCVLVNGTSGSCGSTPGGSAGQLQYNNAGAFAGFTPSVNNTGITTPSALNFLNSSAFNGLQLTFSNPSGGSIQLGATGTLDNSGLTNSSFTASLPSWLTGTSPVSLGGTFTVGAASGQTSHQVIGTCGSATTFAPCALVAADIPILNQNTTGTASNVTGIVSRANGGLNSNTPGTGILRDGTTPAASELSGDATTSGSNAVTVKGINGTLLSGLATGLLKNTTTTGVPSIAAAGTDYASPTNGTSGQVLTSNGSGGFSTALTLAASATTDTTNAANISSGILAAARGGAGTITGALKGNGSGLVSQAACGDLSNAATSCSTDATNATNISSGTLNAARLPAALSSSTSINGTSVPASVTLTQTIASGTAALGTSAIASGACATVVTVTAAGVATTDDIQADFNADPTAVTGYIPSINGMLAIIKYPTHTSTGEVNFKVCNNTTSSITPGAITLNWRVVR